MHRLSHKIITVFVKLFGEHSDAEHKCLPKKTTGHQTLLSKKRYTIFLKTVRQRKEKIKFRQKHKNSTTLRVRKLSPTLLLTKPSVPYLSCSDEKEIFKPGVAVPKEWITFAILISTCKEQPSDCTYLINTYDIKNWVWPYRSEKSFMLIWYPPIKSLIKDEITFANLINTCKITRY